jgi:hypothetical protein
VLVIAALLEGFDAASSVPTLFGDMSKIPGPGFGGFLIIIFAIDVSIYGF